MTTNDEALAARVRLLRNHGAEPKYYHREIGGNFRLDALQAAVLRVKLPHLARWNDRRRANAATYRELFHAAGLDGRASACRMSAPAGRTSITSTSSASRTATGCDAHLASRGIGTEVYYPVPFHRQECFAGAGIRDRAVSARRGGRGRGPGAADLSGADAVRSRSTVVDAIGEASRGDAACS